MSALPVERWAAIVAAAYEGRRPLEDREVRGAVEGAIAALDSGHLRVAEKSVTVPGAPAEWITHGWLQQALALYFRLRVSHTVEIGPFEFHDKIPLKTGLAAAGVRVVPPGVARYGSFLEPGTVLMPGSFMGRGGAGFVRFALVPTPEQCREAIARLAGVRA